MAVPLADEERLVADAGRWGHRVVARCSGAAELSGRLATAAPEIVVAAADPQYLTAGLVAACDAAGARLIAVAGPGGLRHARALGLVDVVQAPFEWSDLESPVAEAEPAPAPIAPRGTMRVADRIEQGETAVPPPRRPGRVLVVWGPEGAPGRTTLAISIAAELAAAGHAVALADADVRAASVAPALGLLDEAPGFAAACRLAGSGALDSAEFERVAQEHRSRLGPFWVLTGLGRPSRWPELAADRVRGTLAAAREWVDYLVVDVAAGLDQDEELSSDVLAPRRNAATLAALAAADHVLEVGSADPVGLARLLRGHTELADVIDPGELTTVVNRVRSSAIGANPSAQVRQTLLRFGGLDDPVLIPWDGAALDAAVLAGSTLAEVAPRSPTRLAVRDLVASRILPPETAIAPERRRERRWLRALVRGREAGSDRTASLAR
ncbi:MAG: regulator [Micrococcales bacterium]|nr:regulator [Micrococcales bacterium]